jgi:hypothetical protein
LIWNIWKWTPIVLKRVNFAKTYQKDWYDKKTLMGKNLKWQKPINHIKKYSHLWKCEINLKIQKLSFFSNFFQNLKSSKVFYHLAIGYNVHDVLKRIKAYYTNKIMIMIWNFYIFKNSIKIYKGCIHF